jgi:hypothetical protein
MYAIYRYAVLMATVFTISAQYKIIIQISPPRSLSTVAMRMWQARGDFVVMNEPFICAYAMNYESERQLTQGWWHEDAPTTYEAVYQKIMECASTSHVFIKELSFSFIDYLCTHDELLHNPDVYFVFLLRHPHPMMSSYYQGHGRIIDKFSYLVGYQPCYEIWHMVDQLAVNKPYMLRAEDLSMHPHETAQALCKAVDIPFMEHMLQWENLGDAFVGREEWHELKEPQLIYAWHKPAIQSTCFHEPTQYAVDAAGNPTFEEVSNDADRAICFAAYDENMHYYRLLMAKKL